MKKIIHNVATGEITEVEMTQEEIAQKEADAAAMVERIIKEEEELQLILGGSN